MGRGRSRTERLTVGRIAKELGGSPSTIRGWERRGLIPAVRRDWRNARVYVSADLERMRVLAGIAAAVV